MAARPNQPDTNVGRDADPMLLEVMRRDRVMQAVIQTLASHGYDECTAPTLARQAGVSTSVFHELYDNAEEALLEVYDCCCECLLEHVLAQWCDPADDPLARTGGKPAPVDRTPRLRACLAMLLERIAAAPQHARVCLVDALAIGPRLADHREQHLGQFAASLERAVAEHNGRPPSRAAIRSTVDALYELIQREVTAGRTEALPGRLPDAYLLCVLLFDESPRQPAR